MKKSQSLCAVFPLLLVLFIDGMGLGILFPILSTLIANPVSTFLSTHLSEAMRDFVFGATIAIYMLAWFFGAATLGDLSDSIGRKKALMLCLVGSLFGYLLSAVAILLHSLALLLLGRLVAGFTAGSQPIAQAAIVDVSTEQTKTRNLAMIILAASLGFVFGPMLGGVLSNSHFIGWFTYTTPFYFAALLALINIIGLHFFFHETRVVQGKVRLPFYHAVNIFLSAFKHERVRWLSLVLTLMMFGWGSYYSFISMFLWHRYGLSVFDVSFFMAVIGLGFSVGCGYLTSFLGQRFELKTNIVVGFFIAALMPLLTVLFYSQIVVWGAAFLMGVSVALSYSTLLSVFSDQVGENEQGWVMGVTGSIMALSFGLTTFLTGLLASMGIAVPMLLSVFCLFLAALAMLVFREGRRAP